MRRPAASFCIGLVCLAPTTLAMGVFGNAGLAGGFRWDAAPRTVEGFERSLAGGLRFSLSGGSYQAFRDSFAWQGGAPPALADFQQAVNDAFNAWTVLDPATGLTSSLSFVADFATLVDPGSINNTRMGAEIDVFASNFGDAGTRGDAFFSANFGGVTLTSGQITGGGPITGADIRINNNPNARYTLDVFRLLLTHEIGHTIGLADVDVNSGPNGTFIDDNYDGTSNATALATLNNSWARKINPFNPAGSSGLSFYVVNNGQPGFDTPGVNILMESEGLGGQFGNRTPLTNDDYAGRQFLYPSAAVPTPNRWIDGSSSWHTASNWDGNIVPQITRDVRFDQNATYTVLINEPASAFDFTVASGNVTLQINNTSLTIDGYLRGSLTITSSGTAAINVGTILANVALAPGHNKLLRSTVYYDGHIDLSDNGLGVDYTAPSALSTVRPAIINAYNGGSWNGPGITSSLLPQAGRGIGYVTAGDIFGPGGGTFFGQSFDATSVLVMYTLLGDTNLDATVNIADFSRLATRFNMTGLWSDGDFDYNGQVNIGDFAQLAANYNTSLARAARSAVPEPALGGLAVLVLIAGARRLPRISN
jgi:hypothetical protein